MVTINRIVVFYFSGTGNAKRIAHWIHDASLKAGIECHLQDIAKYAPSEFPSSDSEGTLFYLISPIHGFNYPKITLDFIRHFPKGNNRIVLMNTRAGMKMGNWITPGLTGIAFLISSFWLRRKGYKVMGQIPYDMPSNWISLHPSLNDPTIKFIHKTIYSRVNRHFNSIVAGQKVFLSHRDIIQDILISPVALLYFFIGRFIIAKTFYASPACDDCGICIKQCPVTAIKHIDNRPFWTVHCESCMKCMNICPQKAIETSHGLLVYTGILYAVIIGLIYNLIPLLSDHSFMRFVLGNFVFFILLILLYKTQHLFLKNKYMAKIIVFTSLTSYKFWGRYKSIPDKGWKSDLEG